VQTREAALPVVTSMDADVHVLLMEVQAGLWVPTPLPLGHGIAPPAGSSLIVHA